jgi:DNA processing protein
MIRTAGLSPAVVLRLVEDFGSAEALLAAGPMAWRQAGIAPAAIDSLSAPDRAQIGVDQRWFTSEMRHLLTISDAGYPPLLRELADPPIALFIEGSLPVLLSPQLAIVGSRNPTIDGKETAEAFSRALAMSGLTITSGLAIGIDAAAHRGALASQGRTVAVLGCGPDVVYPPSHADLAREIVAAAGTLVSEFPPGTPPRRENFPRRNRLISGLALGTLVVEASDRSGSLITARLATEQGREVFAIPGSIHNPLAHGCHRLIREGAKLVEKAQDIIEELGPLAGVRAEASATGRSVSAVAETPDPEYEGLLAAMGHDPSSVDTLVRRSGLTAEVVSSMLLILELRGDVQTVPGGLYAKRRARNPYGSI